MPLVLLNRSVILIYTKIMNPKVDQYLLDGCMRCKLGGTPECKVNAWQEELKLLRAIVLSCGLTEELKWSMPCYTIDGANILMISAFKEFCSINFFKGALLKDSNAILVKAGENTQSSRLAKFTSIKDVMAIEKVLKQYIFEAIEVEKAGLKVKTKKNPEPIPEELEQEFKKDVEFKKAFYALTPGRQRGYILHFSQPKQSKTRLSRIEKYKDKILNGIGFHDEYRNSR